MMEQVIELLEASGFVADGQQPCKQIKTLVSNGSDPSGFSPKLSTVGGRLRFRKDDWVVTVGKRTTYFYTKPKRMPHNPFRPILLSSGYQIPTKDLDGIKFRLEHLD